MAELSTRVGQLATRIANYLRDSILPRLVPSGGSTGKVLGKASATDYDLTWVDAGSGGGGGAGIPSYVQDTAPAAPAIWYKTSPTTGKVIDIIRVT